MQTSSLKTFCKAGVVLVISLTKDDVGLCTLSCGVTLQGFLGLVGVFQDKLAEDSYDGWMETIGRLETMNQLKLDH